MSSSYLLLALLFVCLGLTGCSQSNGEQGAPQAASVVEAVVPDPVGTASLPTIARTPVELPPTIEPAATATSYAPGTVGTPTLTGQERYATKMAPIIERQQTVDARKTSFALGTPYPTTRPYVPSTYTPEPNSTPHIGINNECFEADRFFDYGGCWNGVAESGYTFVDVGAPRENPTQGQVRVYTATHDLFDFGPAQYFSTPLQAGKVTIANVYWPRVTLLTDRGVQPDTTFAINLETRTWEEPGPCQLYPIALHEQVLAGGGTDPYLVERHAEYGRGNGNFTWLSWNGDGLPDTLALSLAPPGDNATYTNPNDPSDHTLSIGDWVVGRPEVSNSPAVESAMAALDASHFKVVVPVWDQVIEQGSEVRYRVSRFAWMYSIQSYSLSQPNTLTFRYWAPATCSDNP